MALSNPTMLNTISSKWLKKEGDSNIIWKSKHYTEIPVLNKCLVDTKQEAVSCDLSVSRRQHHLVTNTSMLCVCVCVQSIVLLLLTMISSTTFLFYLQKYSNIRAALYFQVAISGNNWRYFYLNMVFSNLWHMLAT